MSDALHLLSGMAALRQGDFTNAAVDLTYSLKSTQAAGDRFFANLTLETLARLRVRRSCPMSRRGPGRRDKRRRCSRTSPTSCGRRATQPSASDCASPARFEAQAGYCVATLLPSVWRSQR